MATPAIKIEAPKLVPVSQRGNAPERRLTFKEVIDALVEDGFVSTPDAERIFKEYRANGSDAHPLVALSLAKIKSAKPPYRSLDIAMLTEWLAGRLGLPYYHIDPLKVDMRAVTDVMSSDYATKRNILPVEVRGRTAVIATAEPYITSWQKDLGEMLRLEFTVVIANPLDITRYVGEFYNLSRSVKRAEKSGVGNAGLNNFEQLVKRVLP
jgi:general secretion pathway protein E